MSRNRGWSRSGDMIVGLCDGNRIWRVSPDKNLSIASNAKVGTTSPRTASRNMTHAEIVQGTTGLPLHLYGQKMCLM